LILKYKEFSNPQPKPENHDKLLIKLLLFKLTIVKIRI